MTVYRVLNAAWQLGGDRRLIRNQAHGADVLAVVEARTRDNQPIDLAAILGSEWDVVQDTSDGARAGSALAVRIDSPVRIKRGGIQRLSRRGRDVQERSAANVRIVDRSKPRGKRRRVVRVQHNPIAASGRQDDAVETTRRWIARRRHFRVRWIVLGDFNLEPDEMRARAGGVRCYGVKPMGLLLSRGWGQVEFKHRGAPGTDHVVITMREKP